ncbi:TonB-dependent receptor domain-containing protein [Sediminitomix flava]|uniref:Outer membrane receptor protein involved in Fe transport n=1 Tax=Sediminitomix flava TaxID=379075 RepID=A0A315Z5Z3_SEDFL|nr:TonB-dependent receptor [Sediminitomix flava]PWJ39277.1 outer membrane receptor protein involved in Fe transport [Sediminitomix flava]
MSNKLLLFILSLLPTFTWAQGRPQGMEGRERPKIGVLGGQIIDEQTSEGLAFATISLFSMRDTTKLVTGALADDEGKFSINEIPFGRYQVKVSLVGYDNYTYPNMIGFKPDNYKKYIGKIILSSSAQELNEVVVVGEQEIVSAGLEKRSFNVAADLGSTGSDALQLLSNVPSIDVDLDGNISLRGNSNVKIFIDGKPSVLGSSDYLEQIPSESIESIEVITNPSAKYSPEGMSGILNIKLKKEKLKGTQGMVKVSAGTGDKYNTTLGLSHYQGKFNVNANYSFRSDQRWMESNAYRESFDENGNIISTSDQNSTGNHTRNAHMFTTGIGYQFNKYNSITLGGKFNSFNMDRKTLQTNIDQNGSTTTSDNFMNNENQMAEVSLSYQKKFVNPAQNLEISASYSEGNNGGTQDFGSTQTFNDIRGDMKMANFQIDYTQPLGDRFKLEAGTMITLNSSEEDFIAYNRASDGSLIRDTRLDNNFLYDQQIYAAYGLVSGEVLPSLRVDAGLRIEQAYINSELKTTGEAFDYPYFKIYPSFAISKTFDNESELMFSYSKRVNRPNHRMLNPYIDQSNPENLRQGNPYLEPEFADSYEIGYTKSWNKLTLTGAVYHKYTDNAITRVSYAVAADTIMSTYANLAQGTNTGFELIANSQLTSWWNIDGSFNYFYQVYEGHEDESGTDLSNSGTSWSLKVNNRFNLWKGASLQASVSYNAPKQVPTGEFGSMTIMNLGLQQKVLQNRGTLTLSVSDPLDIWQGNVYNYDETYAQYRDFKRESQIAYISFSYTFGELKNAFSGKRKSKGGKGSDSSSDYDLY